MEYEKISNKRVIMLKTFQWNALAVHNVYNKYTSI